MKKDHESKKKLLLGAGLLTAIIASVCCFGPLLVALLGVGSAAFFAKFDAVRPYFLVATMGLWSYGFYYLYLDKDICKDGKCSTDTVSKRRWFWVITAIIVVILTFPYWIGFIL